jgi:predicted Ser/Thr protein kinase
MNCPRCDVPAPEETLLEFGGVCPKCLLDFSEERDAPVFPGLEIQSVLGRGGMGVVYKATQKSLGRTVALKVLSPELSADPEFVERFTREARALGQLSHPNIVAVFDSGVHDRVPYLIMEYVEGASLRTVLASKKLAPERTLEIVARICDALHYAHGRGIVHRDIKPENILIDREGRVKIADFGLALIAGTPSAQATRSSLVLGTPRYMAPEQFEKTALVDHRADLYSLGVVFYEMLTGELPMGRFKTPSEKTGVDPRLDPIVLKSLERDPGLRFQSAIELKERLDAPEDVAEVEVEEEDPESWDVWSGMFGMGAVVLWFSVLSGAGISDQPLAKTAKAALMPLFLTICWIVSRVLERRSRPRRKKKRRASPAPAPAAEQAVGPFLVEDAWPGQDGWPMDRTGRRSEGSEAARIVALPEEALGDLELIRRWEVHLGSLCFDRHPALLVGLRFKDGAARERWEKTIRMPDLRIKFVGGASMLWLQHNGHRVHAKLEAPLAENVRAAVERGKARRR